MNEGNARELMIKYNSNSVSCRMHIDSVLVCELRKFESSNVENKQKEKSQARVTTCTVLDIKSFEPINRLINQVAQQRGGKGKNEK